METIALLKDNGFLSLTAVKLLDAFLIKEHFAESMSLGQRLLLKKAIEELKLKASSEKDPPASEVNKVYPKQQSAVFKNPRASAAGSKATPAHIQDDSNQKKGMDATSSLQLLEQPAPKTPGKCNTHTFDPFELDKARLLSKTVWGER